MIKTLHVLIVFLFVLISAVLHAQVLNLNGTTLTAAGGSPTTCTAGGFKTLNSASVSGNCVSFSTGAFQNGAIWACQSFDFKNLSICSWKQ